MVNHIQHFAIFIALVAILLLCPTPSVAKGDKDLGKKGKKLNEILTKDCKDTVKGVCDSFPAGGDCRQTFQDMCPECFELLETDEKPSKQCMIDCALEKRPALVDQDCNADRELDLVGLTFSKENLSRLPRGKECKEAILASCPTECAFLAGDKGRRLLLGVDGRRSLPGPKVDPVVEQACWTCVEAKQAAIQAATPTKNCELINAPGTCAVKAREVCSQCFNVAVDPFDPVAVEEAEERGDTAEPFCMQDCEVTQAVELAKAGCKKVKGPKGDKPPKGSPKECRDEAVARCGSCVDEGPNGIPLKSCVSNCFQTNEFELHKKGCKKKNQDTALNLQQYLQFFQRTQGCIKANQATLENKCKDKFDKEADDNDEFTLADVDKVFNEAIQETQALLNEAGGAPGGGDAAIIAGAVGGTVAVGIGAGLLAQRRKNKRFQEQQVTELLAGANKDFQPALMAQAYQVRSL